jgi:hypothetical protein
MKTEELILYEIKKERGSGKKLIPYFVCKCKNNSCEKLTYRDKSSFSKWSGYCRYCSNLIKLSKARLVPNPTVKKPYEALYNNLIKHANSKNINMTLTFDEFLEFTEIKKCHYCSEEIKWTKNNLTKNGSRYNLDRMDNSKGYEKTNLVTCCWKCNNSKGNRYSYEEWFGMTSYFRNLKGELACAGEEIAK